MGKKFSEKLGLAAKQGFLGIWYIIKLPYSLWVKSIDNLVAAKENGKMDLNKMTGEWPFLSFLKVFYLEFMFDALTFFSYFLGFIVAIGVMFADGGLSGFIVALFATYFLPLAIMPCRDMLKIFILPFRKYLSWASKPAQEFNLNIKNEK